ncbi:O-fucosyltransferase 8 isoform X2 [Nymphaea colorata]|uniref:O-fucosyltransferase 8 isoform X2 n=1 Tax=Nymphaea colorata TaxID=210225 RepID=UPI00129DC79B|nr:O-fucosyltransferase 8 isoform X2 [Nymphaea colorata]
MGKQGLLKNNHPLNLSDGLAKCNNDLVTARNGSRILDASSGYSVVWRNVPRWSIFSWMRTFLSEKNGSTHVVLAKGSSGGKRQMLLRRHVKDAIYLAVLMMLLLVIDSVLFSVIHHVILRRNFHEKSKQLKDDEVGSRDEHNTSTVMYERLLNFASHALMEDDLKHEDLSIWKEPFDKASAWKPCADQKNPIKAKTERTGFIMVSANGGLNQQRVAVCNAVAVTSLLNATLVLPRFLYSTVWKDGSQFEDIYQEEYFINSLREDVTIVKELPSHLQLIDIEAVGSLITDMDIEKESKPFQLVEKILPLLLKNQVVHFLGFGNRLAFDPLPPNIQRLRCKCNFHALKFVPKIQMAGSLLVKRIRQYSARWSSLDEHLLEEFLPNDYSERDSLERPSRYLALHLRFEVDMVAYSLCEFGGGEHEKTELQSYREIHFPALVMRTKNAKSVSPALLRKLGRCPLTPEEAALLLSALGFKRNTHIYLAGSHIYGGKSRMSVLTSLYPNIVTKEDLLTPAEMAPFRNFSSQLAALDFIACGAADVFAITDSRISH